jgi:hypothetical protein
MSYLVEKGRFKRVYTNRNDVAQKVGCHVGEIATELGIRKKKECVINGYTIKVVKVYSKRNKYRGG